MLSDYEYFRDLGLSDDDSALLADNGITRAAAGIQPKHVVPFVSAAAHHGLDNVNEMLMDAHGDPDLAWKRWAQSESDAGIE